MATGTIADAVSILATVLQTATNALSQAQQIGTIVQGAQQQGRTELTDGEWALVNSANVQSRAALVDAIQKVLAGA